MRRLKLTIAYDGTDFYGFQVQPDLPTIQGVLEAIFERIEGRPVAVHGSGRTDAGVHALAQVAAVSLENPILVSNLRKAVNRLLPASIRLCEVAEADEDFHPRHGAVTKTYEYRIERAEVCSPFDRRYVHHHPYPFEDADFIAAARWFEGVHDFTAFAAVDAHRDAQGASKIRKIFSSEAWREGTKLIYRVRGSGFLKYMVRNMVGTLIQVAKGKLDRETVQYLLTGVDEECGQTAPACGLFLTGVEYSGTEKFKPRGP